MHYSAKLRAEFSASKIRDFRGRGLRHDFGDGFAPFADMNLTELGGLSDPFTGVVVKFPNRYRLHVTQRVTYSEFAIPSVVRALRLSWAQAQVRCSGLEIREPGTRACRRPQRRRRGRGV